MLIMYSHLANEVRIVLNDDRKVQLVYHIFDKEGKLVRKGNLPQYGRTHNISTNGMPEGQYVFSLEDKSIRFEKRSLFA